MGPILSLCPSPFLVKAERSFVMKVIINKYILRDLSTMKRVGTTTAENDKEPFAPIGTFVSKCIESVVEYRAEPIIEVV
jgi:hypothetical protein